MDHYGFGALQHPGSLTHSIESNEDDYAYMQFPCNAELNKFDGLAFPFTDDLNMDTLQWPCLDGTANLFDAQMMSQLPLDHTEQFAVPQQQYDHMPYQTFDLSQYPSTIAQRRGMQTQQVHQPTSTPSSLDFATMPVAAPSVSSTTTPPHIGPLDYVSQWPTPELEPTTLDDINAWMALDQSSRRSPGSFSSSVASSVATPPYHSRASSLDSVPRFKPTSVSKDKHSMLGAWL